MISFLFNLLGEWELADINRVIRKAISNNNGYQTILGSMVRLAAQFFPRPYPTVDILIYGNNSSRRWDFSPPRSRTVDLTTWIFYDSILVAKLLQNLLKDSCQIYLFYLK